eukprot:351479-Chlamydomonas_euryale.AAC.6
MRARACCRDNRHPVRMHRAKEARTARHALTRSRRGRRLALRGGTSARRALGRAAKAGGVQPPSAESFHARAKAILGALTSGSAGALGVRLPAGADPGAAVGRSNSVSGSSSSASGGDSAGVSSGSSLQLARSPDAAQRERSSAPVHGSRTRAGSAGPPVAPRLRGPVSRAQAAACLALARKPTAPLTANRPPPLKRRKQRSGAMETQA